jgi:hypothetical protein
MMMHWHLGEHIFVEEQRGQDRAVYGEHLIKTLLFSLKKSSGAVFPIRS